jgi:hypothetical protein
MGATLTTGVFEVMPLMKLNQRAAKAIHRWPNAFAAIISLIISPYFSRGHNFIALYFFKGP